MENEMNKIARRRGRPLKFENVEVLQSRIDEYFSVTQAEDITITGLALHLDTSRETLMEYQERPEFVDAIKKAKEMVHNEYEKDLRKKGRSGDIFALKNFGWIDKQEIDHTTLGDKIVPKGVEERADSILSDDKPRQTKTGNSQS